MLLNEKHCMINICRNIWPALTKIIFPSGIMFSFQTLNDLRIFDKPNGLTGQIYYKHIQPKVTSKIMVLYYIYLFITTLSVITKKGCHQGGAESLCKMTP